MASAVATPLERQFGRIAGITQMTSTQHSAHRHRAPIRLERDINAAARDVEAAINAARSQPLRGYAQPADLSQGKTPRTRRFFCCSHSFSERFPSRRFTTRRTPSCAKIVASRWRWAGFCVGVLDPAVRVQVTAAAQQLWHQPGAGAQGVAIFELESRQRRAVRQGSHFAVFPIPINFSRPTSTSR